jgi:Mg2+/citrate symporter
VRCQKKDKQKTAFSTHMGLYQFKVLPFGILNAVGCYEKLIELVLRGLKGLHHDFHRKIKKVYSQKY